LRPGFSITERPRRAARRSARHSRYPTAAPPETPLIRFLPVGSDVWRVAAGQGPLAPLGPLVRPPPALAGQQTENNQNNNDAHHYSTYS
jgi:hypothetical protein